MVVVVTAGAWVADADRLCVVAAAGGAISGTVRSAGGSAAAPLEPRVVVTGCSGAADPAWLAVPRLAGAAPRRGVDALFAGPAVESAAPAVAEFPSPWVSAAAIPAACGPARNSPAAKAAAPPRATRLAVLTFFLLAITQPLRSSLRPRRRSLV